MPLLFVFYDAIKNLFVFGNVDGSGSLVAYGAENMSTSFLFFDNVSNSGMLALAIATGATTFLATYVSMIGTNNKADNPAAGMMKMMLYMMPIMIAFTSFSFPGALALYWMTGNLFSTLQTVYFKRETIKSEYAKKIIKK
jgi:membrane protein insertase Oxa1/YidC/SpoIIIJ